MDKNNNLSEFIILADVPPIASAEHLKKYAEAGFTYYNLTEDYVTRNNSDGKISDEYYAAIDRAHKAGLKVLLRTMNANSVDYYDGITDEFNGKVEGFYIADEPSCFDVDWYGSCSLDELEKQVKWYNAHGGNTLFHVNLLQNYGMELVHGKNAPKYSDYLDAYIEKVLKKVNGKKTLSTDHYPLAKDENGNFIKESAIGDYYLIAERSKALREQGHDVITSFCIQLIYDTGLLLRLPVCAEDVFFQTNFAMAFGSKMLEFFQYAGDEYGAVIDQKNQTTFTPVYDWIKIANERVHSLEKFILPYDWNKTAVSRGYEVSDAHNLKAFNSVAEFQPDKFEKLSLFESSADAVISEFVKDKNKYAYMAVNYTEPTAGISNTVKLKFNGEKCITVIKEGFIVVEKSVCKDITVTLAAGEAVFVTIED